MISIDLMPAEYSVSIGVKMRGLLYIGSICFDITESEWVEPDPAPPAV